jgi:hypothetical protein
VSFAVDPDDPATSLVTRLRSATAFSCDEAARSHGPAGRVEAARDGN